MPRHQKANSLFSYLSLLALPPLLLLSLLVNCLGLRLLRAAGHGLGRLLHALKFRRRIVSTNLQLALGNELTPAEIEALVKKIYLNLGITFLEILRNFTLTTAQMKREFHMSPEDRARVDAVLKEGRGALFISIHMANWELVGMGAAAHGYPVSVIAKKMNNPLSQWLIDHVRTRSQLDIIYAGGTIEKMKQTLAKGRAIGFMLDQNITGTRGIRANFFGVPAASIRAIAGLVKETKAAVFPICANRLPDGTHRFVLLEQVKYIEATDLPQGSPERLAREEWLNTQRHQAALEEMIRRQLDQWLWIHRRWKCSREPLLPGREHLENMKGQA
jgi:KDO2-lipid IV(A) lauroyltransferase